jgi:plasmid stability protein
MSTMIQIRNVPDGLHRRLKARAALSGQSLSDYLLNEIRQAAERPTLDELRARLESRPAAALAVPPAQAVRAEREGR